VARLAQIDERMAEAVADSERQASAGVLPPRFILASTLSQIPFLPCARCMAAIADAALQHPPVGITFRLVRSSRTKGMEMNKLFTRMQDAVRARAAYRRTLTELRQMPLDVALDLDIDRTNAARIAHRAVYGL
jgi:hypothetical protein